MHILYLGYQYYGKLKKKIVVNLDRSTVLQLREKNYTMSIKYLFVIDFSGTEFLRKNNFSQKKVIIKIKMKTYKNK